MSPLDHISWMTTLRLHNAPYTNRDCIEVLDTLMFVNRLLIIKLIDT